MSEEAKKTLQDWLTKMANQDNQCLENLVKINIRKPEEESVDNSENHNISENTVHTIDYYHIEKLYDDNLYQDMKSGKCCCKLKLHATSNIFLSLICICF